MNIGYINVAPVKETLCGALEHKPFPPFGFWDMSRGQGRGYDLVVGARSCRFCTIQKVV